MKLRFILQIISFAFLIWLLVSSFTRIDFAGSKNKALISFEKKDIDYLRNIDSVKNVAKSYLDTIHQNFETDSNSAILTSRLTLVVIIIQVILLLFRPKEKQISPNAISRPD
jgi:hypothetical protein